MILGSWGKLDIDDILLEEDELIDEDADELMELMELMELIEPRFEDIDGVEPGLYGNCLLISGADWCLIVES